MARTAITFAYAAQHTAAYKIMMPRKEAEGSRVLTEDLLRNGLGRDDLPDHGVDLRHQLPDSYHMSPSPRQLHSSALRCCTQARATGPRRDARRARGSAAMVTTASTAGHYRRSAKDRIGCAKRWGEPDRHFRPAAAWFGAFAVVMCQVPEHCHAALITAAAAGA